LTKLLSTCPEKHFGTKVFFWKNFFCFCTLVIFSTFCGKKMEEFEITLGIPQKNLVTVVKFAFYFFRGTF